MLSKFLDPKNDVAFRKIFGTEKNRDILIHFLNDMLTFRERAPITEVTFLKTVQDPEIAINKTSIVDILCADSKGNRYIVEMQVAKEKGFEKRAQYYAAKAYIAQANVNEQYHNLKEIIFLAIANFIVFPQKDAYKSEHIILDTETHEHDLKDFSFTFLELKKFNKRSDELATIAEKWMYFFKHAEETSERSLPQIIGKDVIIERAFEELNRFYWNEEELLSYDQTIKYEGAYNASLEQKYDEGLEKGEQIGIERGRQESQQRLHEEKVTIARKLLQKGMDIQDITDLIDLPIEVIQSLS